MWCPSVGPTLCTSRERGRPAHVFPLCVAAAQVVAFASPSSAIHKPIRGCSKATSACKTRSGAASVCLVIQQRPANQPGRLPSPPGDRARTFLPSPRTARKSSSSQSVAVRRSRQSRPRSQSASTTPAGSKAVQRGQVGPPPSAGLQQSLTALTGMCTTVRPASRHLLLLAQSPSPASSEGPL